MSTATAFNPDTFASDEGSPTMPPCDAIGFENEPFGAFKPLNARSRSAKPPSPAVGHSSTDDDSPAARPIRLAAPIRLHGPIRLTAPIRLHAHPRDLSMSDILNHGDCVEWLGGLPAAKTDLVFADPPFNIDYSYDVYDDARSDEDYLAFCKDWISGVHRVLKDDGTFWLAIGDEYAAELKILSQQLGFHCRSWVIWYYTFGVNHRKGFSRSHTHLFHFVKNKKSYTFNLENPAVRVASARQLVYADKRANSKGRLPDNTWILRPQDAPPGSFATDHDTWFYSRVAGTFKEREGFHGCQMPEQLLGRIIRLCSHPGDTVLDPFGGSGTTLVTAKKLGRQPIGCELSGEYVQRINQRLSSTNSGDPLDGPSDPAKSSPTTGAGRARTDVIAAGQLPPINDANADEIRRSYQISGGSMPPRMMLCDPDRRAEFRRHCKEARVPGDSRIWNHHLLRLIKIPAAETPVTTTQSDREPAGEPNDQPTLSRWDTIHDAAEAALRLVCIDYGLDVDGVLCSDDAMNLFDQMAPAFAGEDAQKFERRDYRIAILACSPKVPASGFGDDNLSGEIPFTKLEKFDVQSITQNAGLYLLRTSQEVLYIGTTVNLRQRLGRVLKTDAWTRFKIQAVAILPDVESNTRWTLIQRYRPLLNQPALDVTDPTQPELFDA